MERLANFQYAAPEQRRRGASVDHRADIYALGLILNEIFTNHVLQGEGYVQIGAVAPAFGYLDDLVARMVQQSPEKRPASIEEVKRTLIARQNEFVSLQKLDALRRTVVPSSDVIDPLVQNPIQVEAVDVRGDVLVVILNQTPTPHWLRAFLHPRAMSFFPGTEPANWSFSGNEAKVMIGHIEGYAQQVLNHFKNYVSSANAAYREHMEHAAHQREENERRALQQAVAAEEKRQRILSQLKT
jgi:serine/threonine protein kinase